MAAIPGELAKLEIQRNDLDRTHKNADNLGAKIAACKLDSTRLENERKTLLSEKNEREQQKASLDTDVTRAETYLSGVQAVLDRLPVEETHREALDAAQAEHKACDLALKMAENQKDTALTALENQQKAFDDNDALCQRLRDALGKVELCTGDGVQEGDWQELLAQYETLLQSQKDSMQMLLSKLQTARSNLDDAENELKRSDCAPEEYQAVSALICRSRWTNSPPESASAQSWNSPSKNCRTNWTAVP